MRLAAWTVPALLVLSGWPGRTPAAPYIEKLFPLKDVLRLSEIVAEGVIEETNPKLRTSVVRITRSLKGTCPYPRIRMNIGVGHSWHPDALMRHLPKGAPVLIFTNKNRQALAYVNRFFIQIFGDKRKPPDKGWWRFTHFEVKMTRTYDKPAPELIALVEKVLRGKAEAPAPRPGKAALTRRSVVKTPPVRVR